MSFEFGTPNYGLPQTVPSDKRDWADTNIPFLRLDQDLHYTKTLAEGFDQRIASVEDAVDEHAVRLTELEKLIEDSEDGSKHEYQPGNLFLKDGRVMVAITEIHEGHTLVEGQNYEVFEYGDSGLEERVEALEDYFELDDTASKHAYSKGQLLLVNGQVCVATANIVVGDALVEGSNYDVFISGDAAPRFDMIYGSGHRSTASGSTAPVNDLLDRFIESVRACLLNSVVGGLDIEQEDENARFIGIAIGLHDTISQSYVDAFCPVTYINKNTHTVNIGVHYSTILNTTGGPYVYLLSGIILGTFDNDNIITAIDTSELTAYAYSIVDGSVPNYGGGIGTSCNFPQDVLVQGVKLVN